MITFCINLFNKSCCKNNLSGLTANTNGPSNFSDEENENYQWIVPGEPCNSWLYLRVNPVNSTKDNCSPPTSSRNMPTNGALTTEEVDVLYDWIKDMDD